MTTVTQVFISYSHKDEALRAELQKHLSILKRQGIIDLWSDHRIPAGGEINASISAGMENADIVLLLVSADFLDSDYCYGIEMERALERRAEGRCDVVPVILRPCRWHAPPLNDLKAIPTDGKALTKWATHDEAFEDIARHIEELLRHRTDRSASSPVPQANVALSGPSATPAQPAAAAPVVPVRRSSNLALPQRFTDPDKHDFLQGTFVFVQNYFDGSLKELQARNPNTEGRMREISARAFQAFIFQDGQKEAACYIRIGGSFQQDAIGYSEGDRTDDNSYNDMLGVQADDQKLFMSATMSWSGREDKKLTQEGAAEYLWERFISPLQQRRR